MDPTIRLAAERDAAAAAAIYAPIVEGTHVSFETDPPSADEMADRIRETTERRPWLVCEVDGEVAGYAYAAARSDRPAYQWGVDTSVYVDEAWRERGIARGLYTSLLELLAVQGYYAAYAVIALPNPESVALHESFGFERVALYERAGFKNGAWHDVGHWETTLRAREAAPSPPTPVAEVRGSEAWESAIGAGESAVR